MKTGIAIIFTIAICIQSFAQTFTPLADNLSSSFRGIATAGKNSVWVSGTQGTVGYSPDGGMNWHWVNPKGYETLDFRDIEVFSEKEVLVMSAGTPTVILRTTNAGKNWKEVLRDERKEIFLDAITFEGKLGYALGDPIDGLFQLFRTRNKGKSWENVSHYMMLLADKEEVAFAASGSSIQIVKGVLYVGTGGSYSSMFVYNPKKLRVDKYDVPIWSEGGAAGIFAIDFWNSNIGIVVGGNYEDAMNNQNNVLLTNDGGKNWFKPQSPVSGYRSDVLYIDRNTLLTTGTTGTDLSVDGGQNWKNISSLSFNALAKSKDGKTIYLTGTRGNVYKLVL